MKKIFFTIGSGFCLLLLTMYLHCGGGASSSGGDETPPATLDSDVGAVEKSTGDFGALMVDSNGESLLPMVERDADGNATQLTGALWTDAEGGNIAVYFDDDGKPLKTVMNNYVLVFSNWSADDTTVDIAKIYTSNNYIEIFKSVSVSSSISVKDISIGNKATCFPACETDTKNLAELLKFAGLGITLGACGVATTVSLGAMALPCIGLVVSTATVIVSDETWLGNIEDTSNILTAVDAFKCGLADAESCISLSIEISSRTLDLADKVLTDNATLISTSSPFLTNPSQASAVVQEGDGLPSCSGSYECTPNAYMPCYPEGVKQCSSSCTWGSCNFNTCGDGTCDSTYAGETYISCSSDCAAPVCGDGLCNSTAGEATSCPSDCATDSCCVSTNNCPSETPYECGEGCCCCGYGEVCNTNNTCSS